MKKIATYQRNFKNAYRTVFFFQILEAFAIGFFNIGMTLFIQNMIDFLIDGESETNFLLFGISLMIAIGITFMMNRVKQTKLSTLIATMKKKIYTNITYYDLEQVDKDFDILTVYTQNFNNFISFIKNDIPQCVQTLTIILIMAIASFQFDFRFFVLSIMSATFFAITVPLAKRLETLEKKHITYSEEALNHYSTSLYNKSIFRFFPGSFIYYKYFKKNLENVLFTDQKKARIFGLYQTIEIGSNLFREIGVIIVGMFILDMSIGEMFALFNITSYLNTSIATIMETYIKFPKSYQASKKIALLFEMPSESIVKHKEESQSFNVNELYLENLSYDYATKELRYPDFELKSPSILEIKGDVGTGKTTLLKIISGLYEPTDGKILVNKQEIDKFKRRQLTAMVDQQSTLFEATLMENISLFDENPKEELVKELLRLVNLEEWVDKLENGLKTSISNQTVSGGQRQRIAICRALYKDANFIILDEATSSLDKENEEQIKNILRNIVEKFSKMIILVDHEGELAQIADQRVTLE